MKITKRQLKKLIEEEILSSLTEGETPDDRRARELSTQAASTGVQTPEDIRRSTEWAGETQAAEEAGAPSAIKNFMDKWGDTLRTLNPGDPWILLLSAVLGAIPDPGEIEEADLNRIEDEIGSALDRVIDYLRRPGVISHGHDYKE